MHVASGRWLYGFLLALTTTLLWGVLPIMLKDVLSGMDAVTVSWYRMLSAGLVLLLWLGVSLLLVVLGIRKIYKEENSYVKSI